jgi:hypothetical protein
MAGPVVGARVFPRALPRSGNPLRAALAIVAGLSAIAIAVLLGALYSLTIGSGKSLDGLVRDVQITTAAIMTAEAAVLWLVLKRAYGRNSEQMAAQARALEAALSESESAYDSTLRALSLSVSRATWTSWPASCARQSWTCGRSGVARCFTMSARSAFLTRFCERPASSTVHSGGS